MDLIDIDVQDEHKDLWKALLKFFGADVKVEDIVAIEDVSFEMLASVPSTALLKLQGFIQWLNANDSSTSEVGETQLDVLQDIHINNDHNVETIRESETEQCEVIANETVENDDVVDVTHEESVEGGLSLDVAEDGCVDEQNQEEQRYLREELILAEHSHTEKVLIKFLLSRTSNDLSIREFLQMTKADFDGISFFGPQKVKTALDLQIKLGKAPDSEIELDVENDEQALPQEVLENLIVNYARFNEVEQKLLTKLSKIVQVKVTWLSIWDIISVEPSVKGIVQGVQAKDVYRQILEQLNQSISTHVVDDKIDTASFDSPSLLRYAEALDIESDELDRVISDDLTHFLFQTDSRTRLILKHRLGLDGESAKTLEHVGTDLIGNITRERVRQLEAKAKSLLLGSIRYISTTIWRNIRVNLTANIKEVYPRLFARFYSAKQFYEFLELIAELDKGTINDFIHPVCKKEIVFDFFTKYRSPAPKEELIDLICDEYGYSHQKSVNAIEMIKANGLLKEDSVGVTPAKLSKGCAIAHGALYFDDGVAFAKLHRFINEAGFCESVFPEERLDNGTHKAVDSGFVYLSDHGTYRHTLFLDISEQIIDDTLTGVAKQLSNRVAKGWQAAHLKIDVFDNMHTTLDYFVVRHIVREYGVRQGIFFKGKSGADTISFEQKFTIKGQKQAILDYCEDINEPITSEDIQMIIRSGSKGHANFYIDQLMKDNLLVRVDYSHLDIPHRAFKDAPISQILQRSLRILIEAGRPIEAGYIADDCNVRFQLGHAKQWYISLLRYHFQLQNKPVYFFNNIISLTPVNGFSLLEIVKGLLPKTNDVESVIEHVRPQILCNEQYIRNAYSNAKSLM